MANLINNKAGKATGIPAQRRHFLQIDCHADGDKEKPSNSLSLTTLTP
jgi:hypothetical protein